MTFELNDHLYGKKERLSSNVWDIRVKTKISIGIECELKESMIKEYLVNSPHIVCYPPHQGEVDVRFRVENTH